MSDNSDNLPSRILQMRARFYEKVDAKIDAVPLFNVLLIAVLFLMIGSHFIFSPGVPVSLEDGDATALPRASVPLLGVEASSVLTVKSDAIFILDGQIYENIEDAFSHQKPSGNADSRGVLLVKLDRSVSVQGLFKIAELAGKAGFSSLQIAGDSPSYRPADATR